MFMRVIQSDVYSILNFNMNLKISHLDIGFCLFLFIFKFPFLFIFPPEQGLLLFPPPRLWARWPAHPSSQPPIPSALPYPLPPELLSDSMGRMTSDLSVQPAGDDGKSVSLCLSLLPALSAPPPSPTPHA